MTINGGATLVKLRTQSVPGNAPAGSYLYRGFVGIYPTAIYDSSSFNFTKSSSGGSGGWVGDWSNWGEAFEAGIEAEQLIPEAFALYPAYPNPFNPATRFCFDLPVASLVKLEVFDVSGRTVAALLQGRWMDAGSHEILFDGSGLSSGVYLYMLEAGSYSATRKMVLMK